MKKLLFLFLICFVFGQNITVVDYIGPAKNYKHPQSEKNCVEYYAYDDENHEWYDEVELESDVPKGVSDCVDTLLYDPYDSKYYDRCCYIRLQSKGVMHEGCMSLTEDQYLDIAEAIKYIEKGDKDIWGFPVPESKVYQLECNSNFIKALSFAIILLALIF